MIAQYNLLVWYIGAFTLIALTIALALITYLVIRRYCNQSKLRQDQEIASYSLNIVALFYCLLIGLVVINVQSKHNDIENMTIMEATILLDIYHTSNEFPEINRDDIKAAIRAYINNVITVEWPLMEQGQDVGLLPPIQVHNLLKTITNFKPENFRELAIYQDLLARQNQLSDARFQRLNSVNGIMSTFLWTTLIYGGLIVIAFLSLFATRSLLEHILFIFCNVSFLVLVLILIYTLDAPFSGPTAISPRPFEEVLEQLVNIDKVDTVK